VRSRITEFEGFYEVNYLFSRRRLTIPLHTDGIKLVGSSEKLLAAGERGRYTAKTAKNPVSSKNRGFRYSIALKQIYNYLTLEMPVKSLFVSGLIGLAAGVIKRLLSLAAFAVGIMELLTLAACKGRIG
jgi:hypothetical protein